MNRRFAAAIPHIDLFPVSSINSTNVRDLTRLCMRRPVVRETIPQWYYYEGCGIIYKYMAAKKTVYIESTIPSYATALPSSNILNIVRKAQTLDFWNMCDTYKLVISQDVLDEISKGDPEAAQRRLDFVKGIELLPELEGIDPLSILYQSLFHIPARAKIDCSHLAYCVLHRIDYLLTWNCAHLGPVVQDKMRVYNDAHNLWTPVLIPPAALFGITEEGRP